MKSALCYDIFISYRREGADATARLLYERLRADGYRVAYDLETLRQGNFDEQILGIIGSCKDFIVVLSPNALDRCRDPDDWVRREIAQAIATKKNIVPILLRNFTFPNPALLPDDIRDIGRKQGIEASMKRLDATIHDLEAFLTSKPSRPFYNSLFHTVVILFLSALIASCIYFLKTFGAGTARSHDQISPPTDSNTPPTDHQDFSKVTPLNEAFVAEGAVTHHDEPAPPHLSSNASTSAPLPFPSPLSQKTRTEKNEQMADDIRRMAGAETAERERLENLEADKQVLFRMRSLYIPTLDFNRANIMEIAYGMEKASKVADPSGQGIKIRFGNDIPKDTSVSIHLHNILFEDAIKYLSEIAFSNDENWTWDDNDDIDSCKPLPYRIEKGGVLFVASWDDFTRHGLESITLPNFQIREASIPAAIKTLHQAITENDPNELGICIAFDSSCKTFPESDTISLSLWYPVSAKEALRCLCEAANLTYAIHDGCVVLDSGSRL